MNLRRLFSHPGRVAGIALAVLAVPAALTAQAPALQMLEQIAPGTWELRYRGEPVPERICVRSGPQLLQLRFRGGGCQRQIILDQPGEVTVQQTCRGQDNSFTHMRKENNRLLQLESQGISDGSPFAFAAEARYVGPC